MGEATVHDLSRNGEQVQVPTTPLLTQLPANAPHQVQVWQPFGKNQQR